MAFNKKGDGTSGVFFLDKVMGTKVYSRTDPKVSKRANIAVGWIDGTTCMFSASSVYHTYTAEDLAAIAIKMSSMLPSAPAEAPKEAIDESVPF